MYRAQSASLSKNPGAAMAVLRELEQKRLTAMRKNDFEALGRLSTKTMVYVHESGRLYHRDEYLDAVASGVLVYHHDVTLAEEEVTIADPALIATGVMSGTGQLGAKQHSIHLRYTAVWLTVDGEWRLAVIQKTPISRRKPPIVARSKDAAVASQDDKAPRSVSTRRKRSGPAAS